MFFQVHRQHILKCAWLSSRSDPAEVSCVWSQARLPDVEVFPFWRVDAHLMEQLWGQCTKSLWSHKCRTWKKCVLPVHETCCLWDWLPEACQQLLYCVDFPPGVHLFNLPTPLNWKVGVAFPLGLLLDLGLGVQLSHSAWRVQEMLLLGHDWVHKLLGEGFWDWQEDLRYRHEIQSANISLNIGYLGT